MKTTKYKVYITEAGNLLFDGGKNSVEISKNFTENVDASDLPPDEDDIYVGEAVAVWGVIDKDNEVLSEQLPFYFQRDYAVSAAKQMNESVVEKKKPYRAKKAFLFYPLRPHHREEKVNRRA